MHLRAAAALIALAMLALPRAEAATVTFADGVFADASWTDTFLSSDAGISYVQFQSIDGGNPGPYRYFEGQYTGSDPAVTRHANVYNLGSFTPALQGSINALDFGFDIGAFDTAAATFRLQFLLKQGEGFYSTMAGGVSVAGPPLGWFPGGATLDSAGFFTLVGGTGPDTPDFSSTGGTIEFGYLSQFNLSGTSNLKTGGIDNWSVSVDFTPTAIPEPTSMALLLAGLVLLGYRRLF